MPALADKVDLALGIDPAFQMERQMEVQPGCRRTGTRGRAFFQAVLRLKLWCDRRCCSCVRPPPVKHDLCGGVAADFFIGQDCHQTLLQVSEAALDLALGLRAGGDQMGEAKCGEGALELGAGIAVIAGFAFPRMATTGGWRNCVARVHQCVSVTSAAGLWGVVRAGR